MPLQTQSGKIVDEGGRELMLRGVCIGGWMNLENFINGYPGAEHGVRAAMIDALGPAKAHFFFERLLDHVLGEADLVFLKGLGINTIRLPLNYRHFESDAAPFQYQEQGFKRLSEMLDRCQAHGLYAILDLHAVAGWQIPTGIRITPHGTRSSGKTRPTRIASSRSGRSWLAVTKGTPPWPGTTS